MQKLDPYKLICPDIPGGAAAELVNQFEAFVRHPMDAGKLIAAGLPTITATVLVNEMHVMRRSEFKGRFDSQGHVRAVWPGEGYDEIAAAANSLDPEVIRWSYA